MKTCFFASALVFSLAASVRAGYEEAIAALDQGDYATAFEELLPLAEQGHANAQFSLGFLYDYGQGIDKDPAEAAKWYRKAAEQDIAVAQFSLATLYQYGNGVPKDLVLAYEWYNRAAKLLASGPARDAVLESMDLLAGQLSADELAGLHQRTVDAYSDPEGSLTWGAAEPFKSSPLIDPQVRRIERAQELLDQLGYPSGPADGLLDLDTRGAIRAFEADHGLKITGEVTDELLAAIAEAKRGAPASKFRQ